MRVVLLQKYAASVCFYARLAAIMLATAKEQGQHGGVAQAYLISTPGRNRPWILSVWLGQSLARNDSRVASIFRSLVYIEI
jgi:hypothetical protein